MYCTVFYTVIVCTVRKPYRKYTVCTVRVLVLEYWYTVYEYTVQVLQVQVLYPDYQIPVPVYGVYRYAVPRTRTVQVPCMVDYEYQ